MNAIAGKECPSTSGSTGINSMSAASPKSHLQRIIATRAGDRIYTRKVVVFIKLYGLAKVHRSVHADQTELLPYFPIALISCIETYFKTVIKELLDHGEPYLSNSQDLIQKRHYDFELLTGLHGHKLTIGDLISYHTRINNLESLIGTISKIMGVNFKNELTSIVDRWSVEVEKNEAAPIISDPDATFKAVGETFNLRHKFCHEVLLDVTVSNEEVEGFIKHVNLFLTASDRVIDHAMYPNAPLTQAQINIATAEECARETGILDDLIEEANAVLSVKQRKQFKIANTAWGQMLEASVKAEGLEYETGSMRPQVENIARTRLTKERQTQIRNMIADMRVV